MAAPANAFAPTPVNSFQPQPRSIATQGPQRIGEILKQGGLINDMDINNALMMSQQSRQPIGQSLMQLGKVNPQQLNYGLGLQQDQRILSQALNLLGQIQFFPADLQYMYHMGLRPPFSNGAQALQLIQTKGVRVEFGDMGDSTAHAQWIQEQNLIMINQKYRGDASKETLYAVSEAICHEAGHAAGNGDNQSSIQEELNCLALNTLAHRFHKATDPAYAMSTSTSPLIANGVALYDRLFFDTDPNKQALVNRVVQKYGDLPLWSPGHDVPPATTYPLPMAYRVAAQLDANNTAAGRIPPSPALAQSQGFTLPTIPNPQAVAPQMDWVA
jgi:hypothetical protein